MTTKNIIIKKDDTFEYLNFSLIYECLLHTYIISSSRLNNEINENAFLKKSHSLLIERKLIAFIEDIMNKVKYSIENKEDLLLNKEESLFLQEIIHYSWIDSVKYENIFNNEIYKKTLNSLNLN